MLVNQEGFLDKEGIEVTPWDAKEEFFKPRYDFESKKWIETATEEEIAEINKPPQIDICEPTLDERLKEAEQKLAESQEENRLLKAQVEANTSTQEFLESCLMEMAELVYA